MAIYTIRLDFQDGAGWRNIQDYVDPKSFKKTETKFSKDFKPVIDTLDFMMIRNETIFNLILESTKDIIVSVQKDSAGYFYGFMRKNNIKMAVSNTTQPVKIQAVSRAWLFKKKISGNVQYAGYTVCNPASPSTSLVHTLAVAAGFDVGEVSVDAIAKTIDYLVLLDNERTYEDVLSKLLFEFGYVYDVDGDGDLISYNFLQGTVTASDTLEASSTKQNIIGPIVINMTDRNYDSAKITHWTHETRTGAIVFSDTTGGDTESKANIEVAAGEYWPLESDQRNIFAEYAVEGLEVVSVQSPVVQKTVSGTLIENTFTNFFKKALLQYENTSGSTSTITKYDIVGDATLKSDINLTFRQEFANGQKYFEYEAEFITSQADATKLASGLAKLYYYSNKEFIAKSRDDFDAGDFIDVIEEANQNFDITCVIQSKIYLEENEEYEYKLLPIEAYAAGTVTTTTDSIQPPAVSPGQIPGLVEDLIVRPTYTEIQSGYDSGGGTTTPTTPTIGEYKGIFKAAILQWNKQNNLTNIDKYQIQVSDDDSTWYSLKFDLTDWKDTLDAATDWPSEFVTHPVPCGGTTAVPTGRTLYYRVRRVTTEPVNSSWSSSVTVTTSPVSAGDVGANSVYANSIVAAEINTLLLNATAAIIVGYYSGGSGTNTSPEEGDRRLVLEDDEMRLEEWTASAWSTIKGIVIGGAIAGLFSAMIGCSGVYHQENPPDSAELFPTPVFKVFNFENNFDDQYGDDSAWSLPITNASYSTSIKKFGTYSLGASTGTSLSESIADGGNDGEDQSFGCWVYVSSITGSALLFNYYYALVSDEILVSVTTTGVRFEIFKDGKQELFNITKDIVGGWHYVAATWKESTNTLYGIVDNTVGSVVNSNAWGIITNFSMRVAAYNVGGVVTYLDEFTFAPDVYVSPNIWVQHYNHGIAWNTDFSAADIVLRCNAGGRIRFDTQQSEESCGTLHSIDEDDRPASWVLAAGSSTSFSDVDFSAYVPKGAKMLKLKYIIRLNGSGTGGDATAHFRKNGSTVADDDKLKRVEFYYQNLASGVSAGGGGEIDVDCDNLGEIEYKVNVANADLWLNIMGYYI